MFGVGLKFQQSFLGVGRGLLAGQECFGKSRWFDLLCIHFFIFETSQLQANSFSVRTNMSFL